ncbi:MAG: SpoIIE family protein phosphatase [Bacteroidia bacterium]|nr:SpoIIE family protein phosphatase [Bacteroidia bacterium]
MRFRPYTKILVTAGCFFLFSCLSYGQTYRFKNYGPDSNIPNSFIYTLNQDHNGYLWVGTGAGLAKFDGFDFHNIIFPDSSVGRYPTTSLRDMKGILWFGCNDGAVYYTLENSLRSLDISNTRQIIALLEGPDGLIYIIPQGGSIFRIDPGKPEKVTTIDIPEDLVIFSASFTQSGDILLGTQENIQKCRIDNESLTVLGSVEGFDYSSILVIHKLKEKDNYIIGTDGNGLFHLVLSEGGDILTRFSGHPELDYLTVQSISMDSDNYLWISTNETGIIQILLSAEGKTIESIRFFNEDSGLQGNNVKLVFQDIEGNYWIGLFGDGLSLLNSYAFSFYSLGLTPGTNDIIYVNKLNDDYFLGTPTGFYLFDLNNNKVKSFTNLLNSTGKNGISSYFVDPEGNIWIGTSGGGLFVRNASGNLRQFYRTGDSGKDYVTDIVVDRKYIWMGTLNGVELLDRNTRSILSEFNINNGLPHNSINKLFLTREGNVAVATKTDRLYLINPVAGIKSGKAILYGTVMNEITSFCQSSDGSIWAATKGNGVFEFYGDSVRSFSRSDLLMSDYCYSILVDSINRIWVGHDAGFSRYNRNNRIMRTYGTDFARGGKCNPGGMYESPDGKVLIGTNQGLIIYDRLKDKRINTAPFNNVNYLTINDIRYPYRPSYSFPYSKRYSVRVHYVGINFSDPDKVYYQTRLVNYDNDWSKVTTEREVPYSLSDGRYKFNLISVNESGLSQDTPITFDISIKKPFWRTWWFILLSIAAITGIIILIIREREKSHKKIQAYLERELDARTAVVVKQKTEIELQNIEITDSINYAKRIQTSILPDFNKLKETFREAFILFRPRDIVSGDFYWFEKFDDEKFILVCADSTGHGVPGAFMSMIGSTLLQDIVSRQRISQPSQVLAMLDKQIFSTLNQNVELGVSNDGMDLVIIEINVKTRYIRFASAMRPVILVLGGEPYYVKGNRLSVGGESVIEKYYDDQEYYLGEGDTIYLFSDGLPDQFGGTDGKKMKIARLKKLIEDVGDLSMDGQKEVITKFYDEWKGIHDQVDDILLIGIRL